MSVAWENWSGSLRFRAYQLSLPESESDIQSLVRKACSSTLILRNSCEKDGEVDYPRGKDTFGLNRS